MTVQQQVCISNNLNQLSTFFKTEAGKNSVGNLADEFEKYLKTLDK
jgi:hypothetical protein